MRHRSKRARRLELLGRTSVVWDTAAFRALVRWAHQRSQRDLLARLERAAAAEAAEPS